MGRAALPDDVMGVLDCDAGIQRVDLTGSRARGTATALSDWDFMVAAADFGAVRDALPSLTAALRFWDWALWLASKNLAGRNDAATAELGKLHSHLLAPLGVAAIPDSLDEAIAGYEAARDGWEKRLRLRVSRTAETAVLPRLRQLSARPQ